MRLRVRKGLMVSGAGAEDARSAGLRAAADIWGFAAPYDRAFGLSLSEVVSPGSLHRSGWTVGFVDVC